MGSTASESSYVRSVVDIFRPKSHKSVKTAYRNLDDFRQKRVQLIKEYVGSYYSNNGSEWEMPVNMMALTVDIYLMHLAGNNPRVILPTDRQELMPYLADLEAIANKQLDKMHFDTTIRRWIMDAFFCLGVIKTGIVNAEMIELIPGEPQPGQEFFCEVVDFDDFVFDTEAKWWDKINFIGDRYRVDYEALMDDPSFDSTAKNAIQPQSRDTFQDSPQEQTRAIGNDMYTSDENSNQDGYKRQVNIWDICLPEEGLIVTFTDESDIEKPLKVVEWDGTSTSPYHTLYFTEVPNNCMPLAPGSLLRSLNKSINACYRKLVSQADRQKTLSLYRAGQNDDAEKIQRASDGDMVPVDDPQTVTQVSFGGPEQGNLAFSQLLRDVFSTQAGNLDALGGLGPQAETYRQDAMIANTVSKKAAKMQTAVVDKTVDVVREILFRIWEDPINEYEASRQIDGTEVSILAQLTPGERPFSWEHVNVKIEPYSMQYRSPQERAGEISQLMTQMVFPILPILQEQGINLNAQNLFQYLSKYMDLPELNNIFEYAGVPLPGVGPDKSGSKMPINTTRTYERVNRPGATKEGNTQTLLQQAAGANPQESQVAALGRSTGV